MRMFIIHILVSLFILLFAWGFFFTTITHTHYLPCVAGEYEVQKNCVWDWGGVGNFGTTTPRTTLQKGDEAIKDQ